MGALHNKKKKKSYLLAQFVFDYCPVTQAQAFKAADVAAAFAELRDGPKAKNKLTFSLALFSITPGDAGASFQGCRRGSGVRRAAGWTEGLRRGVDGHDGGLDPHRRRF